MSNMRKAITLLLLLFLLPVLALEAYPPMPEGLIPAHVEKVVDGDTIWARVVENGIEVTHKIRFLIVDTPETVHPGKGIEPGGIEASDYVTKMLEGQDVYLEYDQARMDLYGRQLCHVWMLDTMLFTLHLVEQGFGQMKIYPPNVKYQDFFVAAQQYAKANKLGIWEERLRLHDTVGVKPGVAFTVETEDGIKTYMLDHQGALWLQGIQGSWNSTTADELIYIINNPDKVTP